MTDVTNIEELPEKVARIEQKLDDLSASVDKRFDEVNKRFDEVSANFVEQREYTEVAFEKLQKEMVERFTRIETKMATKNDITRLERRLDSFEGKLDSFEGKFDEFVRSQSRPHRPRSRRVPKKR